MKVLLKALLIGFLVVSAGLYWSGVGRNMIVVTNATKRDPLPTSLPVPATNRSADAHPPPRTSTRRQPAIGSVDSELLRQELSLAKTKLKDLYASKPTPPTFERRQWTSFDNRFETEAALVSTDNITAKLRKADGEVVDVQKEKLIAEDRTYIENASAQLIIFAERESKWRDTQKGLAKQISTLEEKTTKENVRELISPAPGRRLTKSLKEQSTKERETRGLSSVSVHKGKHAFRGPNGRSQISACVKITDEEQLKDVAEALRNHYGFKNVLVQFYNTESAVAKFDGTGGLTELDSHIGMVAITPDIGEIRFVATGFGPGSSGGREMVLDRENPPASRSAFDTVLSPGDDMPNFVKRHQREEDLSEWGTFGTFDKFFRWKLIIANLKYAGIPDDVGESVFEAYKRGELSWDECLEIVLHGPKRASELVRDRSKAQSAARRRR